MMMKWYNYFGYGVGYYLDMSTIEYYASKAGEPLDFIVGFFSKI